MNERRRWGWIVLALVGGASLWLILTTSAVSHLDLRVFHGATAQLLHGGDLYAFSILDKGEPTPFLYPPFAALLFVPLTLVPVEVAAFIWDGLQVALIVVVLWLLARGARLPGGAVAQAVLVVLSGALLASSLPLVALLQLGQLGLLLAAMVLVDVVLVPVKYRGLLTGVAGAIKLVPLIMLPYYLITRQWRAAVLSAVGFALATAVAFVALPAESVRYWGEYAFNTGRFPGIGGPRNLSVLGVLQYVGVPMASLWWVAISLGLLGASLWAALRLHRHHQEAAAAVVMGVAAGLVSPVSWNHHLIWVPLAAVVVIYRGQGRWRDLGWLLLAVTSIVLVGVAVLAGGQAALAVFYLALQVGALALLGGWAGAQRGVEGVSDGVG